MFLMVVCMTEIIAKTSVVLLHYVRQYFAAKLIYSLISLILFSMMMLYFGIEWNFKYSILTVFVMLLVIFKSGKNHDFLTLLTLLII
jgi:hypothetical protein